MYKRLSNWGMRLGILLVCLVLAAVGINHYDPYTNARKSMAQKLDTSPGIQDRMKFYGQQALEWKTTLQPAFDTAQFVNSLTDGMQNTQACAAIFFGSTAQINGCRFWVDSLDQVAYELVDLDQALTQAAQAISVSQDIDILIDENYQAGKAELIRSYQNRNQAIAGLEDIDLRLIKISAIIQSVMESSLTQEISSLADTWVQMGIPGAESIRSTINIYADLPGVIQPIQIQISADLSILKNIQTDFTDAERQEAFFNTIGLGAISKIVIENLEYFLVALFICFGLFIVGIIGPYTVTPTYPRRSAKPRSMPVYEKTINRPAQVRVEKRKPAALPASPASIAKTSQVLPQQKNGPSSETQPYLLCKWDDGRRSKIPLAANSPTTIGSAPGNNIQTAAGRTAQSQIRIQHGRKTYYLEVLTDSYPTVINSQIILSARQVDGGDIIQIGDLTAVVVI